MPAALARRVRPGDTLAWGIYGKDATPLETASLPVVDDGSAEALEALEADLGDPRGPQPPAVAGFFRAQFLIANDLLTAAARSLEQARAAGTASPMLLRLEGEVLERMAGDEVPNLHKTRYWKALQAAQVEALSARGD